MGTTKIEWAEKSWNPMTGCTRISEGCANCYAKRMAKRLKAMGNPKYFYEFIPTFHPGALSEPTRWKKPCQIFVCSMGDLFHEKIFDREIRQVFYIMERVTRHKYMVLTKRPERMSEYILGEDMSHASVEHPRANIALGITAENQLRLSRRLDYLGVTKAEYRFLSLEPLLGPISLKAAHPEWYKFIDLVIVGGESGPGARMMNPDWVRNIRDDCIHLDVPFMFKQWGKYGLLPYKLPNGEDLMQKLGKKKAGRVLDGEIYDGKINWRA